MVTTVYEGDGSVAAYYTPHDVDDEYDKFKERIAEWKVLPSCSRCNSVASFVVSNMEGSSRATTEHLCDEHGKHTEGAIRCICPPTSGECWL